MLTITRKKGQSVFLFMGDKPIGRVEVSEMTKLKFDAIPELRIVRAELIDKQGILTDAEVPKKKPKPEPKPSKSDKPCSKTCKPYSKTCKPKPEPKPSKRHDKLLDQIKEMDGAE